MGCLCPTQTDSSFYSLITEDYGNKRAKKTSIIDQCCERIYIEDDGYLDKHEGTILKQMDVEKKEISIKDFIVNKIIGRGAFGKVLLVEKKDDGKLFAMKVIRKDFVAQRNQKVHTISERKIMQNMKSPFIVQLHYAFQSESKLYLVMDFMIGGELFFHLHKQKKFNSEKTKLYAAQIILALQYLHKKNIIYRDLKPQNILIGQDGYLKITDFGLSKVVMTGQKSYTVCGTAQYLAPQIYRNKGHDANCDWWSLGSLIYQMLSGAPPFYSKDKQQMLQKRLNKKIQMKKYFSPEAVSLLSGLLNNNPSQRLGHSGVQEIKNHPFFMGLNWQLLKKKEIEMPFKPILKHNKDIKYFDKIFTNEDINQSPSKQDLGGDNFSDYTYEKGSEKDDVISCS